MIDLINKNSIITMDKFGDLLKSNLIYDRKELCWYEKFNRFGALDPYNNLSFAKWQKQTAVL